MNLSEGLFSDLSLRPDEPTAGERQKQLQARVRRLRSAGTDPLNGKIADALEACRPRHRCGLAACPHCATAFQRLMVKAVRRLWNASVPLTKVTMVPVELQRAAGEIHRTKIGSVRRHLRRFFERAGVTNHPVVGFLDVSFNTHVDGAWLSHWQAHVEFLTPTAAWLEMKEQLRKQLKTSPSVKIPLLGVPLRGFEKQTSYCFKPIPLRKTDFTRTSPKGRPHKQHLKGHQELEFLSWLGASPAEARAFLMNVRRYGEQLTLIGQCHQGLRANRLKEP